MRRASDFTAWVGLALLLGGCLGASIEDAGGEEAGAPAFRPVVVALVDSGINPYHEAFRTDGADWAGVDASAWGARPLPRPDDAEVERRLKEGEPLWDGVEPGELYAFPGTRVLGISFGTPSQSRIPIQDFRGHGTATSSLVARDAPHALLVLLQVDTILCTTGTCLVSDSFADAMEWAAAQPWIDVVSVSQGLPLNAPHAPRLHADGARYVAATRAAHDAGKLIVHSAGNEPSLTLAESFSGPPWTITVGGSNGTSRGETAFASRGVDVAANHTEVVARHDATSGGYATSGTSLACPIVAATLAEALWAVQAAEGRRPDDLRERLRDALNATALAWTPTDWKPHLAAPSDPREALGATLPVLAPGPQLGWGHVHAGLAGDIARQAAGDEEGAPPSTLTARWQAEWQAARETYWRAASG